MRLRRCSLAVAICCLALMTAPPAQAFNPIGAVCGIGGIVSGALGKACNVGGKLLGAGKKVLGGGTASGLASKAQAVVGLAAMGAWVLVGAKVALNETAAVVSHTTAPRLTATWFSSTYWRVAAIGAVLTLPFLFAAAVQALLRSDLALLLRAAFGYLPLALIGVGIAAPLAMLLLAATDEMCAGVASAAGNAGAHFLAHAGVLAGLLSLRSGSPFLAFLTGLVAALGALVLWIELLMREAAVYVVVLMLPIVFAALVWPARRVWAIRAVELLVALILSKFVIVAVLTLGGAALGHSLYSGLSGMLAGAVLVILGAIAPWAVIRLLPLAELASTAAGTLRGEALQAGQVLNMLGGRAEAAHERLLESGSSEPSEAESVGDPAREAADAERQRLARLNAEAPVDAREPQEPEPAPPEDPPAAQHHHPDLAPEYQMDDFSWEPFDIRWDAPSRQRLAPEPDPPAERDPAPPPEFHPPPPEAPNPDPPPEPPGPPDDSDPRPPAPDPPDGHL